MRANYHQKESKCLDPIGKRVSPSQVQAVVLVLRRRISLPQQASMEVWAWVLDIDLMGVVR